MVLVGVATLETIGGRDVFGEFRTGTLILSWKKDCMEDG